MNTLRPFKLLFFAFLLHGVSQGQNFDPDYFPSALLKADGVRTVVTYETRIDDPVGQAGMNNRLRLAKNVAEESFFDNNGNCQRRIYFDPNESIRDYVLFSYDAEGHCIQRSYHHRAPSTFVNPDSNAVVLLQTNTTYRYKGDRRIQAVERTAQSPDKDSTVYEYDVQGRVKRTVRHSPAGVLEKRYEYGASSVSISAWSSQSIVSRELISLDAEGRVTLREYFNGDQATAQTREIFTYQPRGWLEEVRYEYPGIEKPKGTALLSRQNYYDDHGKLIESTFDYTSGDRVRQLYDYSYFLSEE